MAEVQGPSKVRVSSSLGRAAAQAEDWRVRLPPPKPLRVSEIVVTDGIACCGFNDRPVILTFESLRRETT